MQKLSHVHKCIYKTTFIFQVQSNVLKENMAFGLQIAFADQYFTRCAMQGVMCDELVKHTHTLD